MDQDHRPARQGFDYRVAGRTLSGQMEDPVARIRPSCNVVGGVWEILRQGRVTWEVVPDEMWPKWTDRPQLLLSGCGGGEDPTVHCLTVSPSGRVVQWTDPIDANRRPIRRQSELADCHDAMLGRIRMLVRMELLGLSRSQNRKASD
ncbi:hypothetical protein NCU07613 [Neurospora crassa OR74A]|uniref:Uncharacterized protein n=1 Tax=Neurospora crassa (strain ATCC 24698 / 74-OR23-1A / CBS 708.71 / DSM 1257 / FGSC 987) TaxID=367110 RepID=Q7SB41_NEUCR|nr:hypothetical protein NCU07613 [Neurospora crassa OR74A]EAA33611.1 hypothetical protein NCU07613 [Neurospora crassa OR74A]|eukprot:XP_962847.1 hypothetical protein NCU07613 [Neurospora crassa OR74A]